MKGSNGLTTKQAEKLLKKFGKNALPCKTSIAGLEIFLNQIKSPLIYILLLASLITLFLKDYTDTVVILFAVFINTILGFYQEIKAESALNALQNILKPHIKVIRDRKIKTIEAENLAPGDLVVLGQGDKVPADGILIEAVNFSVNEAILTGESMPVRKEKENKVFMGTTVISGRARFIVIKTGQVTEMGKIAQDLVVVRQEKTPLQEKLDKLAKTLAIIIALISIGILIIGLAGGNSFVEMLATSVAIAVAAIPEGMVVSLTVILAIGMQKILKRKALVRKLVSTETLGSVTVIATDKTGTLTEGIMRVSKTDLVDEKEAVKTSIFANNLEDPLEIALWEWVKKFNVDPQKLTEENPRSKEVPFDNEKKYMSVTINNALYIKGAPEVVLSMCEMPDAVYKAWLKKQEKWANEGLRLIGLSKNKKWLGLIGIEDPVRKDVGEVFKKCRKAGIRVIMITGDYAGTAKAVWSKIKKGKVSILNGTELDKLSQEELERRVQKIDIFARINPSQKLKIVKALKINNEVVALVGDGVNDAPALKQADIGIVVGEASDVARETADMILLDSNFKTIIAAIEEGRNIFENIKKVVLYLLSDSFSEIILVILSILIGIPLPLTAAQILWINILTDGFPSLALTVEPKEQGLLQRKPIKRTVSLINLEMKTLITIISLITAITSLFVFLYFYNNFGLKLARTVTFAVLGANTLLYAFSVRSLTKPIWKVNHLINPLLIMAVLVGFVFQIVSLYHPLGNQFLQTIPLGTFEWGIVLGTSMLVIILIEIIKLFFNKGVDKYIKSMQSLLIS